MSISVDQVQEALRQYKDPYYPERDLLERELVTAINIDQGDVQLGTELLQVGNCGLDDRSEGGAHAAAVPRKPLAEQLEHHHAKGE